MNKPKLTPAQYHNVPNAPLSCPSHAVRSDGGQAGPGEDRAGVRAALRPRPRGTRAELHPRGHAAEGGRVRHPNAHRQRVKVEDLSMCHD